MSPPSEISGAFAEPQGRARGQPSPLAAPCPPRLAGLAGRLPCCRVQWGLASLDLRIHSLGTSAVLSLIILCCGRCLVAASLASSH